eukprot:Hpha_TRINITY_DN16734_c2_g1::TRINITY_DN16734_c2_g1_i1::g.79249::m.79249
MIGGCFATLEGWWKNCSGWIIRESDTPADISIKRGLAPISIPVMLYVLSLVVSSVLKDSEHLMKDFTILLCIICMFASLVFFWTRGLLGKSMKRTLDISLPLGAAALMFGDLRNAAELRTRIWALVVLVLDISLLFHVSQTVPYIIGGTLAYLLFERAEASIRFGVFDAVKTVSPPVCDCPDPPCAEGIWAGFGADFPLFMMVLLVDFYLTRGFAMNLRRELKRQKVTVRVAGEVTAALARYDVDEAEGAISKGKDLPAELAESFGQLLCNLRSYKAYLPHSCLVYGEEDHDQDTEILSDGTGALVDITSEANPTPSSDSSKGSISSVSHPDTRPSSSESTRTSNKKKSRDSESLPPTPRRRRSSGFMRANSGIRKAAPKRTGVSLTASNLLGYLSSSLNPSLPDGGSSNGEWMARDVQRWCSTVMKSKGVVDFMCGDRRYASFNARQLCAMHSSAAVE